MAVFVRSVNRAKAIDNPAGKPGVSGIDKRPVDHLEVFAPGPNYGDGPGVVGDVVGDSLHHGGADKAVYAFAREKLSWWENELGRELPDGFFGENLTTEGIDLTSVLINQTFQVGTSILQVSVPRSPCRTFAAWVGEPNWIKRFTESGDCGAYFRVIQPGIIKPGDELIATDKPDHGITMGTAFLAKMGDEELARKVWRARVLPEVNQARLDERFGT